MNNVLVFLRSVRGYATIAGVIGVLIALLHFTNILDWRLGIALGAVIFWAIFTLLHPRTSSVFARWIRDRINSLRNRLPRRTTPQFPSPTPQNAGGTAVHAKPMDNTPVQPDRNLPNGIEQWLRAKIKYREDLIEWKEREHFHNTPEVHEWVFWAGIGFVFALCIAYAAGVTIYVPSIVMIGGMPFNPQLLLYPLPLAYLFAGFRQVGTDEVAGADFFGDPVHQFDSGLKWVPWGIFNFSKEPMNQQEAEFPGDADRIQWADEEVPLANGKIRPLYALSGEKPAPSQGPDTRLPTDFQKTIAIAMMAQFRLIKVRFFDLITRIGPVDEAKRAEILLSISGGERLTDKMMEAVRQMRDSSAAIMLEVAGQMSPNELQGHLNLINQLLRLTLQEKIMDWGLELIDARITQTNLGHAFNKEIQKRGLAIATRDNLRITAEGEKDKRQLEGEGTAAAELALLTARAEGTKKMMEELGVDGATIIGAEVGRELAKGGNTVVIGQPGGLADLLGAALAVKQTGGQQP